MRFSDLKKKFPSLRVSVPVIAAFALLGSMMLPSIAEKMGLDEGLVSGNAFGNYDCKSQYLDEYDSTYMPDWQIARNKLRCDMDYDECIAAAESWEGVMVPVEDASGRVLIYVSIDVDSLKAECDEQLEACYDAFMY